MSLYYLVATATLLCVGILALYKLGYALGSGPWKPTSRELHGTLLARWHAPIVETPHGTRLSFSYETVDGVWSPKVLLSDIEVYDLSNRLLRAATLLAKDAGHVKEAPHVAG